VGSVSITGAAEGGGASGAGRGDGFLGGVKSRIGRSSGRSVERSSGRSMVGRSAGRFLLAKNSFSRTTSSSAKLANAEPLPVMPAFAQRSTNSLLSYFSSFANE
jgi:hypothetical protein